MDPDHFASLCAGGELFEAELAPAGPPARAITLRPGDPGYDPRFEQAPVLPAIRDEDIPPVLPPMRARSAAEARQLMALRAAWERKYGKATG